MTRDFFDDEADKPEFGLGGGSSRGLDADFLLMAPSLVFIFPACTDCTDEAYFSQSFSRTLSYGDFGKKAPYLYNLYMP
jgi:hypothetical protein